MCEIGNGEATEILKEEDKRTMKIIEEHKAFISELADSLLVKEELSGQDMIEAYNDFYQNKS